MNRANYVILSKYKETTGPSIKKKKNPQDRLLFSATGATKRNDPPRFSAFLKKTFFIVKRL